MNVLLIGAPGAGKGTQAEKLREKNRCGYLNTGNLFRKHLKENTALGKKARSYIDKGELVPDSVTNDMAKAFLAESSPARGMIFDGWPRNLNQAKAMDSIFKEIGQTLHKAIFLDLSDQEALNRLTGRLYAPQSGRVYHVKKRPPRRAGFCDDSGEALVTRPDDKEEVIRTRLKVFHKNTAPLRAFYKKKGLLREISANQAPMEVFSHILKALEEA